MRFKQFLNEEYNTEKVDYVLSVLKKDCMPFINEISKCPKNSLYYYGNLLFFRAVGNRINEIEKFKTRKDRKPKDTPLIIHNKLNDGLKEKFGWYPRSEGIFVTCDMFQADSYYGMYRYLFFPIGQYKYVYTRKIRDILTFLEDKNFVYYTGKRYRLLKNEYDEIIDKLISLSTNKNICKAVGEVSFKCKEYYLIREIYAKSIIRELF